MVIFLTLALIVASFVLSELLRPKPKVENAKPAGLGDFNFPTATQGRVIPLLWGTCQISGPNVVWYGDLLQVPMTQYMKTGMFSGKRVVTGYRYYVGMQLALCRGEIDSINKVWIRDKLVADGTYTTSISIDSLALFGGDDLGSGGVQGTLRIHLGSQTQSANSYLSNFQDIGGVSPRYLGTAYLVWEQGYIGNSTSVDAWKFEATRIPNGLSLTIPGVNSGVDANPMNVLYELMTDTEWGLGIPPSDIKTSEFKTAATTLRTEGNGYSRLLDRDMDAKDLLREIEQQIDGMVYIDHRTGKYRITLIRNDYDIDLVPQLDESNIVEVQDYSKGAWRETTNQVRVQFNNRSNEYQEDFVPAQDMANALLQGGGTVTSGLPVTSTIVYPGVKVGTLANSIAWRDLRSVSYPLAKANFVVDKSLWDVTPGDVVAWSCAKLGLSKVPMRVLRIDHGQVDDNRMVLKCVQDVFQTYEGLYGDPPDTSWVPQADDLAAFPTDEQLAFEAPRAFAYRDPDRIGDMQDKIWCAGRNQDYAVAFYIKQRHATYPSTPSGDFSDAGSCFSFMRIGSLKSDLASGTAIPTSSILVEADPDSQELLEASFDDTLAITDQGVNLQNLVLVGDEFMLVRSASTSGADVSLDNVYRGVLDGGQSAHSAGDPVYLVFVGGNLMEGSIEDGQNVHIKLLPFSSSDEVAEVDATQIAFTMDDRLIRPYPPSSMDLNGSTFPSGTVSLDYLASGAAETTGIDLDFLRRDYRTAEGRDEIAALLSDAADIFSDFPSANGTVHDAEVWNDPDGSPALLFTEAGISGTNQAIFRLKILKETDGVIPSRIRIVLKAKHDAGGKTGLYSRNELTFDFDVSSAALAGMFNYSALDTSNVSNVYTADAAGTHSFALSSAFTLGAVEYRLNGGSWTTLISAGGTAGNVTGVVATDTIEIRHLSTDAGALKQITMTAPGGGTNAFGILYT